MTGGANHGGVGLCKSRSSVPGNRSRSTAPPRLNYSLPMLSKGSRGLL